VTRKERSGSSSSSKEIAERALYVLDSYALFAYFKDKEGAGIVTDLIRRTARCLFVSQPRQLTLGKIDRQRVLAAAHIKARYPVSYADAFAIALANELGATVVTGDPEFKEVESVVAVLWLRQV